MTDLFLGASTEVTPKDITGTIDASSKVGLTMAYDLLFTVGSAQCTLTGTAYLSSQGVEALGGQARDADFDPATGRFAVVSTTYGPPAQSGDCLSMNTAYDLSKGIEDRPAEGCRDHQRRLDGPGQVDVVEAFDGLRIEVRRSVACPTVAATWLCTRVGSP